MNGLGRRADHEWIVRAMISLPVPVSPISSTGIEVAATRATCATSARDAALRVTSTSLSGGAGSGAWSSVSLRSSRAIAPGSPSGIASYAPRETASTAAASLMRARLTHSHGAPPARARDAARIVARDDDRCRGCGRSANVNVRRIEHPLQGAVRTLAYPANGHDV